MKHLLCACIVLMVALHARAAFAEAACAGEEGWSPAAGEAVPRHAYLVYWGTARRVSPAAPQVTATINGTAVATKVTTLDAAPYKLVLVEIDSDRTGMLAVTVERSYSPPSALYTVRGDVHYPTKSPAIASRYHHKLAHTTVREVFDGLLVNLGVSATRAHVKVRRDDKAAWTELDVPVTAINGPNTIRVGELGCARNFEPALFDHSFDLELELVMPDDSRIKIPTMTNVTIPALAHPTSTRPSDSE